MAYIFNLNALTKSKALILIASEHSCLFDAAAIITAEHELRNSTLHGR
jgi:hypothetical protein